MDFLVFLAIAGVVLYLAGVITPAMIQKIKDKFK